MTKAFNKGRTEAIRTVQPNSVAFTKVRPASHLLFSASQAPLLTPFHFSRPAFLHERECEREDHRS